MGRPPQAPLERPNTPTTETPTADQAEDSAYANGGLGRLPAAR